MDLETVLRAFLHSVWGNGALLLVGIALEHVATIKRYSLGDRIPGLLMIFIGTALSVALSWPLQQLWQSMEFTAKLVIPLWDYFEPWGSIGWALYAVALTAIVDFLHYWKHRFEHRFFWPVHVVHHAPTELHMANNIGHPLQVVPELLLVAFPLSFIQFEGAALPVAVGAFVAFLAMYIHAPINIHFGPLRRMVVDNRFHRIHHSVEEKHHDKNFGICFSVWDWMFGTAYWPSKSEWPSTGVPGVPPPRTIGQFLTVPFSMWSERHGRETADVRASSQLPAADTPLRG